MHFNRISAGQDGYIYLAGESGTLMESKDQGQTWKALESPYHGSTFGVLSVNKSSLLLYGLRGNIYLTEDRARNWKVIENEVKVLLSSAILLRNGLILIAGQGGNLFVSRDLGHSFVLWKQPSLIGTARPAWHTRRSASHTDISPSKTPSNVLRVSVMTSPSSKVLSV